MLRPFIEELTILHAHLTAETDSIYLLQTADSLKTLLSALPSCVRKTIILKNKVIFLLHPATPDADSYPQLTVTPTFSGIHVRMLGKQDYDLIDFFTQFLLRPWNPLTEDFDRPDDLPTLNKAA